MKLFGDYGQRTVGFLSIDSGRKHDSILWYTKSENRVSLIKLLMPWT